VILPYHIFVATSNKENQGPQIIVIFWLVFVIVIISVFMLNAETIKRNFNLFITRLTAPSGIEERLLTIDETLDETFVDAVLDHQLNLPNNRPSDNRPVDIVVTTPLVSVPNPSPEVPAQQSPAQSQATSQEQPTAQQQPTQPATQTQPGTQQPTAQQQPTTQTSPTQTQPTQPATQTRAVYFTQIDRDGQIRQSRVTRRIPASSTPLQDALNIMLTGPNPDELNGNLLSFIPQNTRLLTATVQGTTAYVNFSEDFLYNTFGVEGYVAQLRQIVWTVTEFSNINDVQILIEGRRIDYLGEGIWIGSPIRRESF